MISAKHIPDKIFPLSLTVFFFMSASFSFLLYHGATVICQPMFSQKARLFFNVKHFSRKKEPSISTVSLNNPYSEWFFTFSAYIIMSVRNTLMRFFRSLFLTAVCFCFPVCNKICNLICHLQRTAKTFRIYGKLNGSRWPGWRPTDSKYRIWYNDSNTLYLFIRLSERRTNVTVE